MTFEIQHFKISYVGLSSDWRTNKWRVVCKKCGKSYEPNTTMYATQNLECPKCGIRELVDYNDFLP